MEEASWKDSSMNNLLTKAQMIERMNLLCRQDEPFLFVVDYKGEKGVVLKHSEVKDRHISCAINGVELNSQNLHTAQTINELEVSPVPFSMYKRSFDNVMREIENGNTYLLNLTFATNLGRNLDLKQIYIVSSAPYKMLFNNDFVFYSPEPFIKISDNKVFSFPMKGTIDATLEEAEKILLNNDKERYEHNTIVDLIRNDLSTISRNVNVDKFRYIERIKTSNGEILQTSSQISGSLEDNWKSHFGDILFSLLPAGSISGAPKQKTLEIIEASEISERGFYCGIMGFFNGSTIDSGVIIRYIEAGEDGNFYYRSGGGITSLSHAQDEYNELIKKIYVPII